MPATYEPIATTTLGSNAATAVFSSIPQTYTDLVIVLDFRFTESPGRFVGVRCNGDTGTNYQTAYYGGTGSGTLTSTFSDNLLRLGNGSANSERSLITGNIFGYANTTSYKTSIGRSSTNEYAILYGSSWRGSTGSSFQAITSLTVACDIGGGGTNAFLAGSTFTIYGIKAA
jgi:hypothetical protein